MESTTWLAIAVACKSENEACVVQSGMSLSGPYYFYLDLHLF